MSDLISRQAAIDALKAHEDYKGYLHGDFEEILEALPSAQPEIVRCKDCKHYNSYFVECESESGLKHISDHHQWCCNAERREE